MSEIPLKVRLAALAAGVSMDKVKLVWQWFNGKKTLISSILVGLPLIWNEVAKILGEAGIQEPTILYITGLVGLIVGWGHKLLKLFGVAEPAPTK